MNNQEIVEKVMPKLKKINDQNLVHINMPVDIFNAEAETLYYQALADKDKLVARGLKVSVFSELQLAVDASRYYQSEWNSERDSKEEAEVQWKQIAPGASSLRDNLVDEFDFAFDTDQVALAAVKRIKEGNSNADLVQDLMDLSVLGGKYPTLLKTTNFDNALLETAANLSHKLGNILGKANVVKDSQNETKLNRDRAYTHLKAIVDEVRRVGKFVFRHDREHAAKYASEHKR